jgi:hypothetical protein
MGVLVEVVGSWGREFVIWVQDYSHIQAGDELIDRINYAWPEILDVDIYFEADGNMVAVIKGNADVAAVKIATSLSDYPTLATTQAATCRAADSDHVATIGRTGSTTEGVLGTVAIGDEVFFSVLGYETWNDPNCEDKESEVLYKSARIRGQNFAPYYRLKKWQIDAVGYLEVTIVDISSTFQEIWFATESGGGDVDFSDPTDTAIWTEDTIQPYQTNVALTPSHSSSIGVAIKYTDANGNDQWIVEVETFDADVIPDLTVGLILSGDDLILSFEGDEDLASIRYATSLVSMPTSGDVGSGTYINGQYNDGTVILSSVDIGDTVYVRVRGYSEINGAGNQNEEDTRRTLKRDSNQVVPSVQVQTSQVGSEGYLALVIQDPWSRVEETAFKEVTGGGDFDFTDPTDATWNRDQVAPYNLTESVTISDKHVSAIAWAVGYKDEADVSKYIAGHHVFDIDQIPFVEMNLSLDGGDVYLHYKGDEDTGSIRYAESTSSMPSAGDVDTGTVVAGQSSTGTLVHSGLAAGETYYLRARGYFSATGTGNQSPEDWTGTVEGTVAVAPQIQVQPVQSGSVASLTLVVYDPSGTLNATAFELIEGGSDPMTPNADPTLWDIYDNTDPYTYASGNVNLVEGHNSVIHWAVRFDLGDGNKWKTGHHSFDSDLIPNVAAHLIISHTNAQLILSWTGDEDTGSIKYLASVSSMPTEANLDSSGTYVNTRNGYQTVISGFYDGITGYVRLRGYSGASGAGNQSEEDIQLSAQNVAAAAPGVKVIATQSGTTGTLTIDIEDPDSLVTATSFEPLSVSDGFNPNANPALWSNYDATPPFNLTDTVAIHKKHTSVIWWGVAYTTQGATQWLTGVHTFDLDLVPDIQSCGFSFDDSNNVDLNIKGDEDCANIYINISTDGSDPGNPTSSVYDYTIVGSGLIETSTTADYGDLIRVKAIGYNGAISGSVREFRHRRGDASKLPFKLGADPSQSGNTVTMTIDIEDPTLAVSAIKFKRKPDHSGNDAWSTVWYDAAPDAWTSSTGTPGTNATLQRTKDMTIITKHVVEFKYQITYTDEDGATQYYVNSHTFDSDLYPEVTGVEVTFESASDDAIVNVIGDEDCNDHYVKVSVSSDPGDPGTGDYHVTTRVGQVNTTQAVTFNQLLYVNVRPRDASANWGDTFKTQVRRTSGQIGKTLRISALGIVRYVSSIYGWEATAGYVHPDTPHASQVASGHIPLTLPVGVLITKSSCRLYRSSASSGASYSLYYSSDTGSETFLAGGAHASTGWITDSDTISHTVSASNHYYFRVVCQAVTTKTNARCAWVEVEYTSYDVDETI